MEGISPFLSDIAKDHDARIEYVMFTVVPLDGAFGMVQRKTTVDAYRILIDRQRNPCTNRILFTFYHEVGHVILNHLNPNCQTHVAYRGMEMAADQWAFAQMGMIDACGCPRPERKVCYGCMATQARKCLNGHGRLA